MTEKLCHGLPCYPPGFGEQLIIAGLLIGAVIGLIIFLIVSKSDP